MEKTVPAASSSPPSPPISNSDCPILSLARSLVPPSRRRRQRVDTDNHLSPSHAPNGFQPPSRVALPHLPSSLSPSTPRSKKSTMFPRTGKAVTSNRSCILFPIRAIPSARSASSRGRLIVSRRLLEVRGKRMQKTGGEGEEEEEGWDTAVRACPGYDTTYRCITEIF